MFKGSLGMYRNCILHSHRNVIRFNNAGAGANAEAARGLFLGAQAPWLPTVLGHEPRFDWQKRPATTATKWYFNLQRVRHQKSTFTTEAGAGLVASPWIPLRPAANRIGPKRACSCE